MAEDTILHIKNMVCRRCIRAVENRLKKLDIEYQSVNLGEVILKAPVSEKKKQELSRLLEQDGFELLTGRNARLIEQIKNLIIDTIHYGKERPNINYSDYLSSELHRDYGYLSKLFSSVEGITIEKYIILQKIEKVKELLIYDELSPTEIAYELNYSSLQHMSNQFKKVTGLSPRAFKNLKEKSRRPLDQI